MPIQKSCEPCAAAKRKCDKQLPECRRCIDKEINCQYTQRKKRTRYDVEHAISHDEVAIDKVGGIDESLQLGEISNWDWGVRNSAVFTENANLVFNIDDSLPIDLPELDDPAASVDWAISEPITEDNRPWYLRKETWTLQHHERDPNCVVSINYDPLVLEVEGMLREWSAKGHNDFIHRNLWDGGMPECVQDAFTMLTARFHCKQNMKTAVLQIADERSDKLIQQGMITPGHQNLLGHLARIQALFAHVFVRLFDGSVRLRVAAEKQLPVLQTWLAEMLDCARCIDSIDDDCAVDQHSTQQMSIDFNHEFEAATRQWKEWLVAESIRRTHVIVTTIVNTYRCMLTGWAECTGTAMLSARRGLWQAPSAARWSEIMAAKSPLLISTMTPSPLIAQYSADDFDDLIQMLWKYIVGPEKIQCWVERGEKLSI